MVWSWFDVLAVFALIRDGRFVEGGTVGWNGALVCDTGGEHGAAVEEMMVVSCGGRVCWNYYYSE